MEVAYVWVLSLEDNKSTIRGIYQELETAKREAQVLIESDVISVWSLQGENEWVINDPYAPVQLKIRRYPLIADWEV